MWRMSVDNWGKWEDVVRIANQAAPILKYTQPGRYNDLDMMVSAISPILIGDRMSTNRDKDPCQRCFDTG
jgi:hypothetical protein